MARTSTMRLLTGDFADRLSALYQAALEAEQELNQARSQESSEESTSQTMLEGSRVAAAEARYEELRSRHEDLKAEAEVEATKVVLRAVGRKEWRALKEKHPPRTEGDADTLKGDRLAGVNTDEVEDDLVFASLVEPAFDKRSAFEEWADERSEAEFQSILQRAWTLANVAVADPFSLPVSPTQRSGGKSN